MHDCITLLVWLVLKSHGPISSPRQSPMRRHVLVDTTLELNANYTRTSPTEPRQRCTHPCDKTKVWGHAMITRWAHRSVERTNGPRQEQDEAKRDHTASSAVSKAHRHTSLDVKASIHPSCHETNATRTAGSLAAKHARWVVPSAYRPTP